MVKITAGRFVFSIFAVTPEFMLAIPSFLIHTHSCILEPALAVGLIVYQARCRVYIDCAVNDADAAPRGWTFISKQALGSAHAHGSSAQYNHQQKLFLCLQQSPTD